MGGPELRVHTALYLSCRATQAMELQSYLKFLSSKRVEDLPKKLQSKKLAAFSSYAPCATQGHILYAGGDNRSCSMTVQALILWLCGREQQIEGVPLEEQMQFAKLDAASVLKASESEARLLVFHMPDHKFAILASLGEACLLQSNKDNFTPPGTRTFTLQDWLGGKVRQIPMFGVDTLNSFFSDLKLCLVNPGECERVLAKHFDHSWKLRGAGNFWFIDLPVIVPEK